MKRRSVFFSLFILSFFLSFNSGCNQQEAIPRVKNIIFFIGDGMSDEHIYMSDIHKEKHPNTTQLIRIEKGNGIAIVNGKRKNLSDGVLIIIPPNTTHYIKNTSKTEPLQLYSVYSPPEHPKKLTQRNKPEND